MSIQVTSRAAVAPQTATPSTVTNVAVSQASAEAHQPPKLERVQLPETKRVDLGFRTEEMRKNLQEAVSRLNEQLQSKGRDLSFSLDERIDRSIITVKNLQTGEVVRQIPTEEVVRMAHSIEDMKGVLFNKML